MANNGGFIILWRKIIESEEYKDPRTRELFIHCLLMANWKETVVDGEVVPRGSFISSVNNLANDLAKTPAKIRTSLNTLKKYNSITSIGRAKNSLFIVKNYDKYQSNNEVNSKVNNEQNNEVFNEQITSKIATKEQYLTSNNNINNINTAVAIDSSNNLIARAHTRVREDLKEPTATENHVYEFPLPGQEEDDRPESAVSQIVKAVEESFGRTVSPTEIMTLQSWLVDMPVDVIIMAIHEAAKSNVKTVAYVEGVLRSWRNNAVKSVEDAKEQQRAFAERNKKQYTKTTNQPIVQVPIVKKKMEWITDENGEY